MLRNDMNKFKLHESSQSNKKHKQPSFIISELFLDTIFDGTKGKLSLNQKLLILFV